MGERLEALLMGLDLVVVALPDYEPVGKALEYLVMVVYDELDLAELGDCGRLGIPPAVKGHELASDAVKESLLDEMNMEFKANIVKPRWSKVFSDLWENKLSDVSCLRELTGLTNLDLSDN